MLNNFMPSTLILTLRYWHKGRM